MREFIGTIVIIALIFFIAVTVSQKKESQSFVEGAKSVVVKYVKIESEELTNIRANSQLKDQVIITQEVVLAQKDSIIELLMLKVKYLEEGNSGYNSSYDTSY